MSRVAERVRHPPPPFRVGERLTCIDATASRLVKGTSYTVADVCDLGKPTGLLALKEAEGLFHPRRFLRADWQ